MLLHNTNVCVKYAFIGKSCRDVRSGINDSRVGRPVRCYCRRPTLSYTPASVLGAEGIDTLPLVSVADSCPSTTQSYDYIYFYYVSFHSLTFKLVCFWKLALIYDNRRDVTFFLNQLYNIGY